ncbi:MULTISPECIES: hypothetical protein [Nostocales]|uniref:Uncharacterized protein n=3 Tax=Nostocales TaxID=1161 RepID=A0A8S9SZB1_9CYAN|nr:hypothetical protein [Tolypothrix bouteillei]KAF3884754.1 hypothetical protein DA73_0400004215 [Tolypothrix bouteillei VB521301]
MPPSSARFAIGDAESLRDTLRDAAGYARKGYTRTTPVGSTNWVVSRADMKPSFKRTYPSSTPERPTKQIMPL